MANANLIRKIHKAYVAVYEQGDDALDALTVQPHYARWLKTGMDDAYLEGLDKLELQALFEEIESVVEDLAW